VSYYSLSLPTKKETILSKTFNVEDILDINYLINNLDIPGLDLFTEKKFKEYTDIEYKLTSFDKFSYLYSQRIFSISEKMTLKYSEERTFTLSLPKLYNDLILNDFIFNKKVKYRDKEFEIKYPYSFNEKEKLYAHTEDSLRIPISELPVNCYKDIINFYNKNNSLIDQDYFKKVFNFDFILSNDIFLEILQFIFQENANSIFQNFFTLIHDYNYDIQSLKKFSLRELYLHILVVNNYNKNKQKERKKYEPGP